jgi:glycolate dehydrogenase FAD-binding subunit
VTTSGALEGIVPPEALAWSGAPGVPGGIGHRPEAVVAPASADEVAAVMRWAGAEGVGVLPMYSGERTAPVREGRPYVLLATGRLSGIEVYEAADLTVTAGAGTPLSEIDHVLGEHRQWAPFDPPHVGRRSLGGLVASGESGPLRTGYGDLRNHVLGVTIVTGDARTLRLGGRVVKNVAGFDLLKPVTGSRGTLGVVTSVCLRAVPQPTVDLVLVKTAPAPTSLVGVAQRVATAPVVPASTVIVDSSDRLGGDAALVVRLHGARATVEADRAAIEAHLGVIFEEVSDPRELLIEVSDRGATGSVVIEASARPSALAEMLSALESLSPSALMIDSYGARGRASLASLDGEAVARATRSIEESGGALRVASTGAGAGRDVSVLDASVRNASVPRPWAVKDSVVADSATRLGSSPTAAVVDLISRLEAAFDPQGVLWPAR